MKKESRSPRSVRKIYKQLKSWKIFLFLSRGEILAIKDELEQSYPGIEEEISPKKGNIVYAILKLLILCVILSIVGVVTTILLALSLL